MLFLRPTHTELLALAADVIDNWDPCNTSDVQRDEVVLAGKAAAVAIREFSAGCDVERATAFDIVQFYRDFHISTAAIGDMDLYTLWSQLARDIRFGYFGDELMSSSVHELLTVIALRCLQVANPTYHKPQCGQFD